MQIHKLLLTQNDCYKRGRLIVPEGIMAHSTGANNPYLRRYIGPDDGIIGENKYNNHWNMSGLSVCVHAFIGKDKDDIVRIYQTLPWYMRGWHCGGKGNDTHISIEICEDSLADPIYCNQVYEATIYLCVYLCKEFGFDPMAKGVLIDHSEGYKLGIASNHGDIGHWWPKHGKSMDALRMDVKKRLLSPQDAIEKLTRIGVINSPQYWLNRYNDVKYLDNLLINMAIHCTRKQATIKSFSDALDRLTSKGVINTPAYWIANHSKVLWLDKLIINAAEYV